MIKLSTTRPHATYDPSTTPRPPEPSPGRTIRAGVSARLRHIASWTWRIGKRAAIALGVLLLITAVAAVWGVVRVPVERPPAAPTVNDVTQLNPIPVHQIVTPTTAEEIVTVVKSHAGPVSIGGGRYSMGGQTATSGSVQIDMRKFNRVLAFDRVARTITVQPGIRWREIQDYIDPYDLSVKIMQTYANFTVGGSLSVNVHGRYIGLGPLVLSVRSIKVVLADGRVVDASPAMQPQIFYGAIGGYGGLGVIVEATLDLADNVHVKRFHETLPVTAYHDYFFRNIRDSAEVVFHNGDIYPNDFTTVSAVTYRRTSEPVTVPDRLVPRDRSYRLNRVAYWVISEWPFGKKIREHVVEPLLYRDTSVVEFRNYEASYDVADLEPSSRAASTYVLQEYFVPVERFDAFVPKMAAVFRKHDVNVINVSIRHAKADPGTLLAWAPREVFAFVVYYKQGTDEAARRQVGIWTREMTDSVVTVGGSWYLPYQPHATDAQFARGYTRSAEFFALKKRVDPTNKFRNTLWDKYYAPQADPAAAPLPVALRTRLDTTAGYRRDEGQTFLTHPEWYIVYSCDEYASYLRDHLPTDFPYVASIGQFWVNYREMALTTRNAYPFNGGYHVMLGVIGTSYSLELALKGIYENSVGRFSGWTAGHQLSDEDHFAAQIADDYGRFIHVYPWYEYHFADKLGALWTRQPLWGRHVIRKWERKLFLSAEYGIKAVYATVIERATRAAYTPQEDRMQLVASGWTDSLARVHTAVHAVARLDERHTLLAAPRYDAFRDQLLALARSRAPLRIDEVAGNDDILLTGLAPAGWQASDTRVRTLYALPLPTDPARKRVAVRVRVPDLLDVLAGTDVGPQRLLVDHIYDY